MNKKILIGSIIAVAILVLVSSSSALDVKIQNKDDDIYLITLIRGHPWSGEINGMGIFRELTAYAPSPGIEYIKIYGIKISEGKLDSIQDNVHFIRAPRFIGFYHDGGPTNWDTVFGIAIGEIEWR